MNQRQIHVLGGYVRFLADALRLKDVQVDVVYDGGLPDGTAAEVRPVRARYLVLAIGPAFCDLPPDEQRHVLVHELLHGHLEPIREVADSVMEELGGGARRAFRHSHDRAVDAATDEFARLLAPYLPTLDAWDLIAARGAEAGDVGGGCDDGFPGGDDAVQ